MEHAAIQTVNNERAYIVLYILRCSCHNLHNSIQNILLSRKGFSFATAVMHVRYTISVKKSAIVLAVVLLLIGVTWSRVHHTSGSDEPADDTHVVATTDKGLDDIITNWTHRQGFQTSAVVEELTGKKRAATINATESMVMASTFKLYVAYAVLHAIERGTYSLNTTTSDGNSIQTDLTNMIVNSDNDAARTLGFMIGWTNIDTLLRSINIKSTDLNNYVSNDTTPAGDKYSTAGDLGLLLDKLYDGTLLNKSHTQLLLGLMEQQEWRERIPAGVPGGVTVADKPGWLSPADDGEDEYVQNDAAIVYGPRSTYILVIMTGGGDTGPLTSLSSQVYSYLET